jgi:hypothetical protein
VYFANEALYPNAGIYHTSARAASLQTISPFGIRACRAGDPHTSGSPPFESERCCDPALPHVIITTFERLEFWPTPEVRFGSLPRAPLHLRFNVPALFNNRISTTF